LVWESSERDAWVADAQRWVTQIIGVQDCVINLTADGEIEAVHVTASTEKPPRRIVRDVETLLKARLEVDIDYKKISVAQLNGPTDLGPAPLAIDDPAQPPPGVTFHDSHRYFEGSEAGGDAPFAPPKEQPVTEPTPLPSADPEPEPIAAVVLAEESSPRVVCANVGLMSGELSVRAEVLLRSGDLEALGTVEGPNHAGSDNMLLAQATVQALTEMVADPVLLHVREIRTETLGNQMVFLTAIDLVEGRRSETLFGACSAAHNRQQAVVHAVLDALNRRLVLLGLKSCQAEG
jgi:hypothetical protein